MALTVKAAYNAREEGAGFGAESLTAREPTDARAKGQSNGFAVARPALYILL